MKKILIFALLLLSLGIFAADLHVTPYSENALNYAKFNKYNVILWFVNENNATYNLRDEILLNGQLIAATEDVMWMIADTRTIEGQNLAYKYRIYECPTIISLDIDGNELYGSRFSYSLFNQNIPISDTILLSLVANNVIEWEVADNWYDNRYVYNQLNYVDYTYWNCKPVYDYQSDYYNDNSIGRYYDNSYNSNNLLSSVTYLYQIYPSLPPITSNCYEINNKIIKVYNNYIYKPRVLVNYNGCTPKQMIFAGCKHNYDKIRYPRIHTFSERMENLPRNLTLAEKQKLNPLKINYKKSPFYKNDFSYKKSNKPILKNTNTNVNKNHKSKNRSVQNPKPVKQNTQQNSIKNKKSTGKQNKNKASVIIKKK